MKLQDRHTLFQTIETATKNLLEKKVFHVRWILNIDILVLNYTIHVNHQHIFLVLTSFTTKFIFILRPRKKILFLVIWNFKKLPTRHAGPAFFVKQCHFKKKTFCTRFSDVFFLPTKICPSTRNKVFFFAA